MEHWDTHSREQDEGEGNDVEESAEDPSCLSVALFQGVPVQSKHNQVDEADEFNKEETDEIESSSIYLMVKLSNDCLIP